MNSDRITGRFRRSLTLLPIVISLALSFSPSLSLADDEFLRGDVNGDGNLSISDARAFFCVLFCATFPPPCEDAVDADDDGNIDIADMVAILLELFTSQPSIGAPFPDVGADSTDDRLDCERYEITPPSRTDDLVRLGDVEAYPGDSVRVPFLLESSAYVDGVQLVVSYDPAIFTPLPVDDENSDPYLAGTALDEMSLGFLSLLDFPEAGLFRVGYVPALVQPVGFEEDELAIALFIPGTIAADAESGTVSELAFASQDVAFGVLETELTESGAPRLPGRFETGSIRILAPARFVRGDSNLDQRADISDAIHMLQFLFLGGADITCRDAADVNDNGFNDLPDSIGLLNHLFEGGLPPQAPWPGCGVDETEDALECEGYPACR